MVAYVYFDAPSFSAFMGGAFALGGIALLFKSRHWLRDFEELMAHGRQFDIDVELVNSGGGGQVSDTFLVRIFGGQNPSQPDITFETTPTSKTRSLNLRQRHAAILLRREEGRGMVAVFVGGETLLPNGAVRYRTT